jgi:hypothetical protein
LICIDASLRCRLDHQIPSCRGDLCIAKTLPELNVKIAARELTPDDARHDQPFRHAFYYRVGSPPQA